MLRFDPDKTKVVFFDLEYYVPVSDRQRKTPGGMAFSPVMAGHRILGGTFLTYYPLRDRVGKRLGIWEWREGTERKVMQGIFEFLQREWRAIEGEDQAGSLMLAGIGISHSDVPALLARLSASEIASKERIYDLVCGCRQIDLTTATYCQFSFNHEYFAYPKTKSALYQKYLSGKKIESGKAVWEMYEGMNFEAIELRSNGEIDDALRIYKNMFEIRRKDARSLQRLKQLEKRFADSSAPGNDFSEGEG